MRRSAHVTPSRRGLPRADPPPKPAAAVFSRPVVRLRLFQAFLCSGRRLAPLPRGPVSDARWPVGRVGKRQVPGSRLCLEMQRVFLLAPLGSF